MYYRKVSIVYIAVLAMIITSTALSLAAAKEYHEAPMLANLVKQGRLPPVEKRLPEEPLVVEPIEQVGQYGGTWRHATQSPTSSWVNARTGYEPLVRYARDGKSIAPNIAKEWKILDGGKTYVFYLRKGMKWSDGVPFTADDIMFLYEDILLNKELTPTFPAWLTVGGVPVKIEKIDDYTVRFRFVKPYGILLEQLAQFDSLIPPKHYLKQFHPRYIPEERLEAMAKKAGFEHWYQLFLQKNDVAQNPDMPVVKPWKLVSTGQTQIVLERNPYYWKVDPKGNQLPYIDRRILDLVREPNVVNMRTLAGEFDAQLEFLAPANYTLFMEGRKAGDYRVFRWKRGESGFTLFPNQTLEGDQILASLLRNEKFRTALSLAINRSEIQEIVYLGLADPVDTVLFAPSMWDSKEAHEIVDALYSYNPRKANALLDQLGLRNRSKAGYRLRPDGKELSLTIEVPMEWPELVDAAEMVRADWEKLGIRTSVKSEDSTLFQTRSYANKVEVAGYLLTYTGWISDPRDYVPVTSWGVYWGHQYALWYLSEGKSGLKPPEDIAKLIDLYENLCNTFDMKERAALEEALFKHYAEKVIAIPTVGLIPNLAVAKNNFRNLPEMAINSWPLRFPGYFNPEQFFIQGK